MAKLSKGKNVNTDVLERICIALDCRLEDICELSENNKGEILSDV
jgi:DNA-binding Xre family transcriptional regulator